MTTRIIFMGSPDFAVPILQSLVNSFDVAGVVTQPDQGSGRGLVSKPPPVKIEAQKLGLPVIQPDTLKSIETVGQLQQWKADLIVVAAYGKILRANILNLPRLGCVNVHASLLPRWRGATPIQSTILHGDAYTGVTIMVMDAGIDTGPILSQKQYYVSKGETAETLSVKLAELGASLIIETLPLYVSKNINPIPQDDTSATYAPILKKENGLLNFNQPGVYLARQVRAYTPWPGSFTFWEGKILKILHAHAVEGTSPGIGSRTIMESFPAIGTRNGQLILDEVQLAGKKQMRGDIFLRGVRNWLSK